MKKRIFKLNVIISVLIMGFSVFSSPITHASEEKPKVTESKENTIIFKETGTYQFGDHLIEINLEPITTTLDDSNVSYSYCS